MRTGLLLLGLPLMLAACAHQTKPSATQAATMPGGPGVARFNVDPGFVQGLADERHVLPLSEWPLYENTNFPVVKTPEQLRAHAAADHTFGGPDLGLYRVMKMRIEGQDSYVFYHEQSKTLVLVPIR